MKIKLHLKRIRFFLLIFLGFLFLFSCSPRYRIVPNNIGGQVDPELVHGILPNGFQYILKKNNIPKDRVYIHLDVFAGSMHENDDQQGIAHYLEHMLFNGSEHFKPGDLVEYFHSIGMDFGADANAHTSFFNTVYDLALPDGSREQLDKAFLILQDYAQGALLLESEVDRERGVILAEKRERDSVGIRVFKKTLAFELPGSLINDRYPIGIESVLTKADRNLLKKYYDRWYQPNNMAIIIVGDIDVDMITGMIKDRFSKLNHRSSEQVAAPLDDKRIKWKPHQGIKTFHLYEPEASATDIAIQTINFKPYGFQTEEVLKQEVLLHVANSILQNRISQMINSQQVSFTEASAYSGNYLHYIEANGIAATCQPQFWEQSLEEIDKILRQALKYGFSQKELKRVKSEYISSLEQAVDLSKSRKSDQIAKQILSKINNRKSLMSHTQKLEVLRPYIDKIDLSKVHKALVNAWDKQHRLITVTGNLDIKSKQPEADILNAFKTSLNQPVTRYAGVQSKSFPYLEPPARKGNIRKSYNDANDLGVTILEFDNNVRLQLKQTDFKPNSFMVKINFGQGKRSLSADKTKLLVLAEDIINESGLGGMSKDQLDEALSGKKINTQIQIKDNYFSIHGTANPADATILFQMMHHHLRDPGFSSQVLDRVKIQYKQHYESQMRTPDGIMAIKGNKFLASGNQRFGLPEPDDLESVSLNDLQEWLVPLFQKSALEISIVGDFKKDEIIDLTSVYFGSLPERNLFPESYKKVDEVLFPAGQNLDLEIETAIETAMVRVAILTDDFWDIMQTRQLSVLSRVISERLRKVIREELGESYSPYVYNHPSTLYDGYGVMHIVVSVKPGNQELVVSKIENIIQDIHSNGVTEQETMFALNPIKTYLKTLRQTNDYWLNSVMSNASNLPEKFEWARNILSGYNSISNKDLTRLSKKYLQFSNRAVITISPVQKKRTP